MRINPNIKALSLAMTTVLLASGCATSREAASIQRASAPVVQERFTTISKPVMANETFRVQEGFYAARTPISTIPVNARVRLPESFFKSANMNIQSQTSLMEIVARISKLSGYQVHVDQDVTANSSSSSSSASGRFSTILSSKSPVPFP